MKEIDDFSAAKEAVAEAQQTADSKAQAAFDASTVLEAARLEAQAAADALTNAKLTAGYDSKRIVLLSIRRELLEKIRSPEEESILQQIESLV